MKYFNLFFAFIFSSFCISQNDYLDYAVNTNGDTIYGVIKYDKLVTKGEKTLDLNLKIKSYRKNDKIYIINSSVEKSDKFSEKFTLQNEKLKDYIVTKTNDTIFGQIKNPLFGLKYIRTSKKNKVKLHKIKSVAYRENNEEFRLKTISRPILSTTKNEFLKAIYNGNVSLYSYKILRNDAGSINPKKYYFIEKNDKLFLISNSNYKQQLIDLFIDNNKLIDLIDGDFYEHQNIYLVVKYYDKN